MKRGISLVVLVITIIVSTILVGVIVINATDAISGADKMNLQSDISQLEILMSTYKIRKNGVIDFETVNVDLSNFDEFKLQQFEGETIVDNLVSLYIIDLEKIDAENVSYGKLEEGEKDRYLYSITTGKVYYEQGLIVDGNTYYYVQNEE